jgi:5-deoxy-glucuronate isomerase
MAEPILRPPHRQFQWGWTHLLQNSDTRMEFSVLRLRAGETFSMAPSDPRWLKESAWTLMSGRGAIQVDSKITPVERHSLFDENPSVLHVGRETFFTLTAETDTEWTVAITENSSHLEPCIFLPADVSTEHRGHNLVQGACARFVRLVFDKKIRPDANLVVGEVINQPGRWSSYPPHHHSQPEIYHYRFSEAQGYGHAEVGDAVFKVFNGDTSVIPGGLDHAQVSAPGYAMYYLWVVRHLDQKPYEGFEFTPEHAWTLNPDQQGWRPRQ